MANHTSRTVTTVRREYALRRPTNWAEIGKVYAAINQEFETRGIKSSDDRVTVDANDDEIVFTFDVSSDVSHG